MTVYASKNDLRTESEVDKKQMQVGDHSLPLFPIFTENARVNQNLSKTKRKSKRKSLIPTKNFRFQSLSSHFVRSNRRR